MRLRLVAIVLAFALHARADETSPDVRALFDEARRLMTEGDFQMASRRLEEALTLQSGRGIKYQLAVCYEKLGRTASARVLYLQVAYESHQAGELDREAVAREQADRVGPRVPKLTIDVRDPVRDLVVRRDDAVVGRSAWNAPLAIDPGEHVIRADAPGRVPFTARIALAEGEQQVVVVPALDASEGPSAGSSPRPSPHSGPWRAPMLVLGAVGVAALGAGFAFAGASAATYGSAAPYCNASDHCSARGVSLRGDALSYGDAATAFVIGGAAAVVAATIVWLWNPRPATKTATFAPGLVF